MTQQDKELLLEDLCARLLYGVKGLAYIVGEPCNTNTNIVGIINKSIVTNYESPMPSLIDLDSKYITIKPYLRPMSSMTEEERNDLLVTIVGNEGVKYFRVLSDGSIDNTDATIQDLNKFNMHWVNFDKDTVTSYLDWFNAHYFDYRNLIEKGLAIEVTEENNPYKE